MKDIVRMLVYERLTGSWDLMFVMSAVVVNVVVIFPRKLRLN